MLSSMVGSGGEVIATILFRSALACAYLSTADESNLRV
jgi:hypothetical protein